jgi:dUTP pyrophosphatase
MISLIDCKLDDIRCLPVRAHDTDAGMDLVSVTNIVIYPGEKHLLDTGVALKIPQNYAGFVLNRSSQRVRGITSLGTGLIDSDYRGTIKVWIQNTGDSEYVVKQFETKIAQLVIMPVALCDLYPVETDDDWSDTDRGVGGFGSTGS